MSSDESLRCANFRHSSQLIGLLIIFVGATVLAGWVTGTEALKSILPSFVSMKANTALGFLLGGIALFLLGFTEAKMPVRVFARFSAFIMTLIGLLTCCEYFFGWDLGIDQLLFIEPPGAIGTVSPGRMALTTAISFFFSGLTLLTLDRKKIYLLTQFLSAGVGLIGLVNVMGYLYGVREFFGIAKFTQMAIHTGVSFFFFGLGILFSRPSRGIMVLLTSDDIGGITSRRLLPIAIVTPLVLGWLRIAGDRARLYSFDFGVAMMMVVMITLLSAFVFINAVLLAKAQERRKKAEDAIATSEREWQKTFDAISDLVFVQDKDYNIIRVNDAVLKALKKKPEQVIGKKCFEVMHSLDNPWPGCPYELTKHDMQPHTAEVNDPNIGVPLLITISPIFNAKGEFIGAVHIAKDITERKKMEVELKERITELEGFRKITVGRELKMIELKTKIAELQERIEQLKK